VPSRVPFERRLARALAGDELVLHFQPLVSLVDGRTSGTEALVRWQDPERGLLAPRDFVPLAEEHGLIDQLGAWVLHAACRQAARWRGELGAAAPLPVQVNVSPHQLAGTTLPGMLATVLADTGAAPGDVALEVTETALLERPADAAATLHRVRAQGVRVLLDDFGAGYSSLRLLEALPLDALKIDATLVEHVGDGGSGDVIVGAVVALGHALGLEVVAEGVERERQAVLLRALGCDRAQGFLHGRPGPAWRVSVGGHAVAAG